MKVLFAIPLIGLCVACTSERIETSKWTIHTSATACPAPDEASPVLLVDWGRSGHEIDGLHCHVEELVEVVLDTMAADAGCCYAVECEHALDATEQGLLYSTACLGGACSDFDLDRWTAGAAAEKLAEELPVCTIAPGTTAPAQAQSTRCVYAVTARYTCES